ncbi:hypothetical protein CALCODRAFT_195517 [Calocera cornea HHB12733]|uniref:Uncharacterized protein n=1 Tax=Calocera cornea HHB12733 TaxID=1353952 RepID=A0A165HIU6_9BASI|nr:hypothetical protein CALCODRAFT_195517 [Calocera cornea HHB12733]
MAHVDWDQQYELLTKSIALARELTSTLKASIVLHRDSSKPSRIRALEEQLRSKLQAVDEARNWTLSSISRLPDDLLRTIFLQAYDGSNKVKFPRMIGSICRRWREVALDTANLWRLLRFPTNLTLPSESAQPWHPWYNPTSNHENHLQPLFAANLQRARKALLDAELRLTVTSGSQQAVRTFLDVCGDRTADLFMTVSPSETTILQLIKCVWAVSNSLRRFSVYFLRTDTLETHRGVIDLLLRTPMPHLTDVTFHEFPIPIVQDPSYVLLSSCRSLNISLYQFTWVTMEHFQGLLESCPQLVKLILTVPMQARQDFSKRKEEIRLTMPHLREYTVKFSPYRAHANSAFAFSSITAPAIDILRIQIYGSIPTDEARTTICRTLEGFIHASSPIRLRILHLRQGAVQTATRVLPLLPSLTVLHLSFEARFVAISVEQHTLLRTVLARLGDGPEEMACPALEALFTGTWAFSSHLRLLQQVAQARKRRGQPLRRLVLADWPSQTVETVSDELPTSAGQAYDLETALAEEVGELTIGDWRFDGEGRTWEKSPRGRGTGGAVEDAEEIVPM